MDKNLNMAMLLDFYGQMLTEKKARATDLYYNSDLSLSEIADEMSISRQGVRDLIKKGEKQLTEFEEALGLVKRFADISAAIEEIRACCGDISEKTEQTDIKKDIEKIIKLTEKITEEM